MIPIDTSPDTGCGAIIDLQAELRRRRPGMTLRPAPPPAGSNWQNQWVDAVLTRLTEAEQLIVEQRERIAYLEGLSMTDELTGLLNRRGFLNHFRRELSACRRSPTEAGVLLLLDLDGFKAINDSLGHLAGDAVLRHVARALSLLVRPEDVVARLGGDEFAILLCHTEAQIGQARAQHIEARFDDEYLPWQGHRIPVRVSVGAQVFTATDDEAGVLGQADAAMYTSKAQRRTLHNRIGKESR